MKIKLRTWARAVTSCGVLTGAMLTMLSAQAHHSTAQFDMSKQVTYVGTVKKFDYQNPHAWIYLEVPQADGSSKEVSIECGSPAMLRRNGLAWDALKKGEKVTIVASPFRDEHADGGILNSITWPDGHKWASMLPGGNGPSGPAPAAK